MLRVEKNIEVIGDIELAKITITAGSGLVQNRSRSHKGIINANDRCMSGSCHL